MENLIKIIEEQQKGHENEPRFMIGEQLKDIASREPLSVELLVNDLTVKEMNLEAAEKRFQRYSDENHKMSKCFCITPAVAESILRDFYGLPKSDSNAPTVLQQKTSDSFIDLSTFF